MTLALLSRRRALAGCSSPRPAARPPPVQAAAAQRRKRLFVQRTLQQPVVDGAGGVQRGWSKKPALDNSTAAHPRYAHIWQHMRQLQVKKAIVTVKVAAPHRRGLLVSYEPYDGLGLLPSRQLLPGLQDAPADGLVGTELPAVITAVDEEKQVVIFSNKLASTQAVLQNLKVGDVVTGVVQGVKPYGAFVELHDGVVGLLHVSEISHDPITSVEAVLKEGEELEVMVVGMDKVQGRLALSVKQAEQYLCLQAFKQGITCPAEVWQQMRQLKKEDSIVTVKIEGLHKRGYLARYEPCGGLGFLPTSKVEFELRKEIKKSSESSLIGRELPVSFEVVDQGKKLVVFSNKRALRGLQKERSRAVMQSLKVGDVVTGVVQDLEHYGAFVNLQDGAMGLLHNSQISHEHVASAYKVLKKGDELKVLILDLDQDHGEIVLSTKNLEPTPGDMLRDPQLVFEKAEEMAETFRQQLEASCAAMQTV